MNRLQIFIGILCLAFISLSAIHDCDEWGFFGHRRINRLAIFTLPPEMIGFFKSHIDYVTDHAVDPDKRRYATKHEAVRHYIDLDIWGSAPYDNLPREWGAVLACYSDLYAVMNNGDTVMIYKHGSFQGKGSEMNMSFRQRSFTVEYKKYLDFFRKQVLPQYYEDNWEVSAEEFCTSFQAIGPCRNIAKFIWIDRFSEHGILPYHLEWMQNRLTEAFRAKDEYRILRFATEIGHYIGDAHVPLHTTVNYNGQLTNQDGIHAFWESRIPELFADTNYDFFVGPANYIEDTRTFYWDAVLKSHSYVDSVLSIELRLRKTFPEDLQFCFDERLGRVVRTQCREFAEAYHQELKGQVEERFRASILALGSIWYTAWVDAGQPDLRTIKGKVNIESSDADRRQELETMFQKGEVKGREHEN